MVGKTEEPHYNLHISQNNSQAILGLSNPEEKTPQGFCASGAGFEETSEGDAGSTAQHRERD